jgi:hypothetical protein
LGRFRSVQKRFLACISVFLGFRLRDCLELGHQLPERDLLVAPSQFNEWLHTIERLTATRLDAKREFWSASESTHALEITLERIEREIDVLREAASWKLAGIAGRNG